MKLNYETNYIFWGFEVQTLALWFMKLTPDVPGIATSNSVQFCLSFSDVMSGILLPTVGCERRS